MNQAKTTKLNKNDDSVVVEISLGWLDMNTVVVVAAAAAVVTPSCY